MERIAHTLIGSLVGLLVGLGTIGLGMLGGMNSAPPGTPANCTGLIVALLMVSTACGGVVSWRLERERSPGRRWR